METKNCPLCGAKGVIMYIAGKPSTIIDPASEGFIGGAQLNPGFGTWDYSHHKECTKLNGVTDSEGLLRYHMGDVAIWRSADVEPVIYEAVLAQYGFMIGKEGFWCKNEKKWISILSLQCLTSNKTAMTVEGNDYSAAFKKFEHRLLCGEFFYFGENAGLKYQLQQDGKGQLSLTSFPR